MAANPTYNDGGLEYGSSVLTVADGGAGFTCIADSEFSFDEDSKRVEQTNQYGEPIKAFGIPTTRSGSCTVQLPSGKKLLRGYTFTTDIDAGAKVWIVTKVNFPHEKEGYRKQAISFVEKLN